jgi:hypothetical protein
MKRFLLDTNAIIDYVGGVLPHNAISVINQIEMLGFNPEDPADLIPFEELAATVAITSS